MNVETLPRMTSRGVGGGGARRLLALAAAVLIACAALAMTAATTQASASTGSSCTVAPPPTTGPAATESFYQYTGSTSLCAHRPRHSAQDPHDRLACRLDRAAGHRRAAALPHDQRAGPGRYRRHLGAAAPGRRHCVDQADRLRLLLRLAEPGGRAVGHLRRSRVLQRHRADDDRDDRPRPAAARRRHGRRSPTPRVRPPTSRPVPSTGTRRWMASAPR